jgi:8-oxo-dGTP pyrophosphatase MutT (NUDIX family)
MATALREAQEEVGLEPALARVLGHLPDYRTVSNFLVTPVIAEIPWPLPLRPAPAEVSHIFSIPLPWLADPNNRRIHRKYLTNPGLSLPVIYFKPYAGEHLWGVSARITLSLLQVLGLTSTEPGRGDWS